MRALTSLKVGYQSETDFQFDARGTVYQNSGIGGIENYGNFSGLFYKLENNSELVFGYEIHEKVGVVLRKTSSKRNDLNGKAKIQVHNFQRKILSENFEFLLPFKDERSLEEKRLSAILAGCLILGFAALIWSFWEYLKLTLFRALGVKKREEIASLKRNEIICDRGEIFRT
jgi:hypothetical protein